MAKVSSDTKNLLNNIQAISNKFASERAVRQKATRLSKADFDSLKEAGFLLMAVPEESGGFWRGTPESLGEICQCLRVLFYFWMFACLANLGLPGLSGFVAETAVFYGSYTSLMVSSLLHAIMAETSGDCCHARYDSYGWVYALAFKARFLRTGNT